MRELLAQIAAESDRAAGTTLVVGAGTGAELPMLRRVGNRRLILAEAHPQIATELSARIRRADGEEVWGLAIAPEPGPEAELRVLSNLRYCSLREPERLLEQGPNLRKQRSIEVESRSLAQAIELAVTDQDRNHLLILDAPGLNVELLQRTDGALIQRFAWVLVHASAISDLYRGEASHELGTERLQALGFARVAEDPDALYPEVVSLYRRDDHRIELLQQTSLAERLRGELAEAREQAVANSHEHHQRIAALEAEQAQVQAERDDLRAKVATFAQQLERAAAEQEAGSGQVAQLQALHQSERERADGLQQQLDSRGQALDKLRSERDQLHQQVQTLVQEREVLAQQLRAASEARDALDAANRQQTAEAEAQRERAERLERELASASQAQQALAAERDRFSQRCDEQQAEGRAQEARLEALAAEVAGLVRDKEALTSTREEQRNRLAELTAEVERLRAECDRLEDEKRALDLSRETQAKRGANEMIASLDRAEQKLSAQQQRIDQLEYELTESSSRQRLLDEELVKAEAQLDLVKDLLLREQTL